MTANKDTDAKPLQTGKTPDPSDPRTDNKADNKADKTPPKEIAKEIGGRKDGTDPTLHRLLRR